jgi:WbqC-like protein family
VKLAVMQPYFLPYIGYFQLIAAVDLFIVYDNIKYTKKGWINRNRLLQEGRAATFTLPLKGDSDRLDVRQRALAADFRRDKLLNQVRNAYRRAPYFARTFPLIEQIVRHDDVNLFRFLHHSIVRTCAHLGTTTPIEPSSAVAIDPGLKAQDRVLALCRAVGATTYVNASGGAELYEAHAFRRRGIDLKFIQPGPVEYLQFGDPFVPWLSIIDVMMFNPLDALKTRIVNAYRLS